MCTFNAVIHLSTQHLKDIHLRDIHITVNVYIYHNRHLSNIHLLKSHLTYIHLRKMYTFNGIHTFMLIGMFLLKCIFFIFEII